MIKRAMLRALRFFKGTFFVAGAAVMLALVFGFASSAFGANGNPFLLGKKNVARAVNTLVKQGAGPALRLIVRPGNPPMAVNSDARVANLNADKVDGQDAGTFQRSGAVAGGDLSGNYPNPRISPGAVGAPQLGNVERSDGDVSFNAAQQRACLQDTRALPPIEVEVGEAGLVAVYAEITLGTNNGSGNTEIFFVEEGATSCPTNSRILATNSTSNVRLHSVPGSATGSPVHGGWVVFPAESGTYTLHYSTPNGGGTVAGAEYWVMAL